MGPRARGRAARQAAPRPGRRATRTRSSTTPSSAAGRSRRTPPRAHKLRSITAFTIEPKGPFTLASAARFVAGWPPGKAQVGDDELRLHFLVDDWSGPARVVLRQDDTVVTGTVEADNEPRAIEQAARIVSLDHDGTGYAEIDDPIVQELQRASGYLRPVLFHSPYEAAAWSVISARTGHAQAVKLRDALGETFPTPDELLAAPGARRSACRTRSRACTASPARRWRASSTASRCWRQTRTRPTRDCRSCRASARSMRA